MRDLIEAMEASEVPGAAGIDVTGLAYDSRRVRPGDVFFGLTGLRHAGARFVADALAAGAVAAVVGREAPPSDGLLVRVAEPRLAMARAAAAFHGHPARVLEVVGVTGTNGKTTTTWLVEAVLRGAGRSTGVIGTTGVRFAGQWKDLGFTTPEAPELQGLLAAMRDRGVRAVAIELSSHALHQRRCHGVECDATVFTNLTHDHLDYHGTLEAYLDAKLMLFDGRNGATRKSTVAVVNADDPAAPRVIAAAARGGQRVVRFGADAEAELRIASVMPRPDGVDVTLDTPDGRHAIALPLLGRHNAWNAAAAWGACRAIGVPPEAIARGLAGAPPVPGRLEPVEAGQPFTVVVDYAHSPDALARALTAAREHARGRVLLVFGCGGDRDRAKRPVMGAVAREQADRLWVTSDNPRSEDPAAIAAEVVAGTGPGADVELDRREAIASALAAAEPGDVVLIAGKGHETTQTIGDRVLPFDDRAVARELLAARGGAGAVGRSRRS